MSDHDPMDFAHLLVELGSEPPEPPETIDDRHTTEHVVASMLAENTGRHMLDSGGAYGRAWERNQGRDFASEPTAWLEGVWNHSDLWPIISTFHFLTSRLEYEHALDQEFHEFAMSPEWKREPWIECLYAWAESKEWKVAKSDNTYNCENYLDQDFQFHLIVDPATAHGDVIFDAEYVAIETHNGADARGGYSAPRIFSVASDDGIVKLLDVDRVTVFCNGREPEQVEQLPGLKTARPPTHAWDVCDGDVTALTDGREDGPRAERRASWPFDDAMEELPPGEEPPRDPQGIAYFRDGTVYCPRCGAPLHAEMWPAC